MAVKLTIEKKAFRQTRLLKELSSGKIKGHLFSPLLSLLQRLAIHPRNNCASDLTHFHTSPWESEVKPQWKPLHTYLSSPLTSVIVTYENNLIPLQKHLILSNSSSQLHSSYKICHMTRALINHSNLHEQDCQKNFP